MSPRWMLLAACFACRSASISPAPPPGAAPMSLTVSSTAFVAGSPIPADNTCDGADTSFPVAWSSMPEGVKSIAIEFDDTDANRFTHWLVFGIEPDVHAMPAGGGVGTAATNDFDRVGYAGPCPPAGSLHHYRLRVFGLDTQPALSQQAKRDAFDRALSGHVIAEGQLLGTYLH